MTITKKDMPFIVFLVSLYTLVGVVIPVSFGLNMGGVLGSILVFFGSLFLLVEVVVLVIVWMTCGHKIRFVGFSRG